MDVHPEWGEEMCRCSRQRGKDMTDATVPKIVSEASMDSAGVELMALSFRLSKSPEFADDAERIREIGGWISAGRPSDMEMTLLKVVGALVGTMRRRNTAFSEDLPMLPQFEAFLDAVPDPVPGEACYVDPNSLPLLERRDRFEAQVVMAEVNHWTAGDGIERAISCKAIVTPKDGTPGEAMVYAEGALAARIAEGVETTLVLRSTGGALAIQE